MNPSIAVNQLENQQAMKEVRKSKTIFSNDDYLNHRFVNGDQKEELVAHLTSLRPAMSKLEKLDQDTKQTALQLGRRGEELLEALDEVKITLKGKFSKKKYIELQLGYNKSRFYEAVSISRAVKAGASQDLSLTKLQILGAALNSAVKERKDLALSCIEKTKLPSGVSLIDANVQEFVNAFRESKIYTENFNFADLINITRKISSNLRSLLDLKASKGIHINEDIYSLKNELLALSDLIKGFENEVTAKAQMH